MIEQLIKYIAPHSCIACNKEGSLWCAFCRHNTPEPMLFCYRCRKKTHYPEALCTACRRCQSPFMQVYASTRYAGKPKELIHLLKYGRAKDAATDISRFMSERVRLPAKHIVVVPVPTATSRIRARGYDQAALIAHAYARRTGCRYASLLGRLGQNRQVGKGRAERKTQTLSTFRLIGRAVSETSYILLVDDVITTGATLEAAALTIRNSGYARIGAMVFAAA